MFVSVLLTVTDVKAASEPIDGGKEQYGTYIHTPAIKRGRFLPPAGNLDWPGDTVLGKVSLRTDRYHRTLLT